MMQEIAVSPSDAEKSYDSLDEEDERPAERWAPLGAASPPQGVSSASRQQDQNFGVVSTEQSAKLQLLEEEQEELNGALLALTTHFAQVQFRLQQICKADSSEKETLWKRLNRLSFRAPLSSPGQLTDHAGIIGAKKVKSVKPEIRVLLGCLLLSSANAKKYPYAFVKKLLNELEEFASKGAPDLFEAKRHARRRSSANSITYLKNDVAEQEANIEKQRLKQLQLISQLKEQLEDLEKYAYESGDTTQMPSNELLQKQKVIIESLQGRVDLPIDQLNQLSHEELQKQVEQSIMRLINPIKIKDQLVEQLKTQIDDLHRFIDFLQAEGKTNCTCPKDSDEPAANCIIHGTGHLCPGLDDRRGFGANNRPEKHDSTMIDKTISLLQVYVLAQLGCQSRKFQKNQLKTTTKGCHWGDLRAAFELAVNKVAEIAANQIPSAAPPTLTPSNSDDDLDEVFSGCGEELVAAVRKFLAPAIRDLLQHGLLQVGHNGSSSRFGCFPDRSGQHAAQSTSQGSSTEALPLHAWGVLMKFYEMKHGKELTNAPVRKLTQSFNLDSIGGRAISSKQILLTTIDSIVSSHSKLKRSPDSHFKAFVSAALNHKKLVSWLRMVLRTRDIVTECYAPWSYVAKTGFEDAFRSLEKLNSFSFCLPVDFAVRPFQNMKDAF